ncbi:asparagine synthase (glutamine-hydrolyzing) [uncultured Desulfovibrio sp.]|uniref:asparagine synthase (glutamine-hydrolyzing) n=1 Tax=uncultured Desulfovibrio sp. TaxID=167968 RepID=UPI0025DCA326|nr:asparagine synthase (glutamine-hydrolyzing) [uncultured Desulfovibrio sp.]
MCGICGLVGGRFAAAERRHIVERMKRRLIHRGPDEEGAVAGEEYALGHRRLSIIDLTTGRQPFRSPDQRFCIVYNGELYNYVELRQELESEGVQFFSNSDTEVLLNLLIRKGTSALARCNGMFAFALYDCREKTLLLCRDHAGIKPLYYTHAHGGIAFASEIKALFDVPGVMPSVNQKALQEYLVFQFCFGSKTLFAHIDKLEPGQCLLRTADGKERVTSWSTRDGRPEVGEDAGEEALVERLRGLLQQAVHMQMRSDVPVGAYLSGGLDSSSVAYFAAQEARPLHCFTGRFLESPAYDESRYARMVAESCGAELHIIEPTAGDFVAWMPRIIHALDEPVAGPGAFPQFMVSAAARNTVKVVLGGQGGDELFGGYTRYLVACLELALHQAVDEVRDQDCLTLADMLPGLPSLRNYKPMLRRFFSRGMFEPFPRRYYRLVDRSPDLFPMLTEDMRASIDEERLMEEFCAIFSRESRSPIDDMLRFDQRTLLPALLQIEDRASMSASLESRVPLLTPALMEFAAALPALLKIKNGKLKHMLLAAMRDLLPAPVLERKDKMGFPVPLTLWMRQDGPVREFVADTLLSQRSRQRGIMTPAALERMLSNDSDAGRPLWGALCLELWFTTFQDQGYGSGAADRGESV